MNMNFDSVIVRDPSLPHQQMTAEEFSKITISERVRLVSRGYVEFHRHGEIVRPTEAFKKPS
jgi:hypothetical protein